MSECIEIVIVGGGTAGWMFAAAIANQNKNKRCRLTLIESDQIGTVGVGEATLPSIKSFNDSLGINEADMMRETNATFKLGIEFKDWGRLGSKYIHPFGTFGDKPGGAQLLQQWVRLAQEQTDYQPEFEEFSYAVQACRQSKFEPPSTKIESIQSTYSYAYHFDAVSYAIYLRKKFEGPGLKRIEGRVVSINQHPVSGNIESLLLESGDVVAADYFIDCTGFSSLIMDKTLKVEFEDWSNNLICDRAVAIPSEVLSDYGPFTTATAKEAGWQWRIPLQHRTGNGYVYSSEYLSDDEALDSLLGSIQGEHLAEPNFLKFKAGRRKSSWAKNCIAVGLASGFLEPLESTSIYLIQAAIKHFISCFPSGAESSLLSTEFNRLMDMEYDRIKDFLILHYHLNDRNDTEFWRYCNSMGIPESLKDKIALFSARGFVEEYRHGLFSPASWISVFVGQGVVPRAFSPSSANLPIAESIEHLKHLQQSIRAGVDTMPKHLDYVSQYCTGGV